ncbi:MAG: hypothetical protein H0T51_20430 [Pirellulales bacterium]|nr:hypothetical protein [Pirellulales bacterium]
MTPTSNVRTAVVAVLLFAVGVTTASAAERPANEWLRGAVTVEKKPTEKK